MDASATSVVDPIVVKVEPGYNRETLKLRFPADYKTEMEQLLIGRGVRSSPVHEFSAGWGENAVLAIGVLGTASGLKSLSHVLRAFIERHHNKRVEIRADGELTVEGYSEKDVRRILESVKKRHAEQIALLHDDTEEPGH